MPLYLYECPSCKYEYTRMVHMADRDRPTKECPVCTSETKRIIGNNGGFRLGTKGKVSWAKGGYSTLLGDVLKAERS